MATGDAGSVDPRDDPDYISEDGASGKQSMRSGLYSAGWLGRPDPVFVPKQSTPLADDDEGSIPRYAMWSMKYLRRSHLFSRSDMEIRESFGENDNAVYVMDDGRKHCLISRRVGSGADGSIYCLVAEIPVSSYEQLVGGAAPEGVFATAKGFSLCSVFEAEDAVSNVTVVESYRTTAEVPSEYLPPGSPIVFEQSSGS